MSGRSGLARRRATLSAVIPETAPTGPREARPDDRLRAVVRNPFPKAVLASGFRARACGAPRNDGECVAPRAFTSDSVVKQPALARKIPKQQTDVIHRPCCLVGAGTALISLPSPT